MSNVNKFLKLQSKNGEAKFFAMPLTLREGENGEVLMLITRGSALDILTNIEDDTWVENDLCLYDFDDNEITAEFTTAIEIGLESEKE